MHVLYLDSQWKVVQVYAYACIICACIFVVDTSISECWYPLLYPPDLQLYMQHCNTVS